MFFITTPAKLTAEVKHHSLFILPPLFYTLAKFNTSAQSSYNRWTNDW